MLTTGYFLQLINPRTNLVSTVLGLIWTILIGILLSSSKISTLERLFFKCTIPMNEDPHLEDMSMWLCSVSFACTDLRLVMASMHAGISRSLLLLRTRVPRFFILLIVSGKLVISFRCSHNVCRFCILKN